MLCYFYDMIVLRRTRAKVKRVVTKLPEQANKHQLLSPSQMSMVGSTGLLQASGTIGEHSQITPYPSDVRFGCIIGLDQGFCLYSFWEIETLSQRTWEIGYTNSFYVRRPLQYLPSEVITNCSTHKVCIPLLFAGIWSLPMSQPVPRQTFRWSPPPPLPPPLRVIVAWPAQVTQVTQVPITLTQHDTTAPLSDMTHPMWPHRGRARPEPPPPLTVAG